MAKSIIVYGAHGKVGQRLIRILAQNKINTTAVVRNETQAQQISKVAGGAETTKSAYVDLANTSVKELASQVQGHDAVVFTGGSAGKNILQVDLDAAVKTFEAAVEAKVRRYILVSAVGAENREFFEKTLLRDYYIGKHYADRILINEFSDKLDFTILKPTLLTDGDGTGKIQKFKPGLEKPSIDRQDVAQLIYRILDLKSTFGKSYDFTGGDEPIENELTWA